MERENDTIRYIKQVVVSVCMLLGCNDGSQAHDPLVGESFPRHAFQESTNGEYTTALPVTETRPTDRPPVEGVREAQAVLASQPSPNDRGLDLTSARRYLEEKANAPVGFDVPLKPLSSGQANPDCRISGGTYEEMEKVLEQDLGEPAVYLSDTEGHLVIRIATVGVSDGIRWVRENGPLCKSFRKQLASYDLRLFRGLTPKTCNEVLAGLRALSCLFQVKDALREPIKALEDAKVPLRIEGWPVIETCSEVNPMCRGARARIDFRIAPKRPRGSSNERPETQFHI